MLVQQVVKHKKREVKQKNSNSSGADLALFTQAQACMITRARNIYRFTVSIIVASLPFERVKLLLENVHSGVVSMVTHIARVWINRVLLPSLLVVS